MAHICARPITVRDTGRLLDIRSPSTHLPATSALDALCGDDLGNKGCEGDQNSPYPSLSAFCCGRIPVQETGVAEEQQTPTNILVFLSNDVRIDAACSVTHAPHTLDTLSATQSDFYFLSAAVTFLHFNFSRTTDVAEHRCGTRNPTAYLHSLRNDAQ